jgi:hypothetical protein
MEGSGMITAAQYSQLTASPPTPLAYVDPTGKEQDVIVMSNDGVTLMITPTLPNALVSFVLANYPNGISSLSFR